METNNPQSKAPPLLRGVTKATSSRGTEVVITQIDDSESGEERFSVEIGRFKLILIVERPLSDDEIEDILGTINEAE